MTDNKFEDIPDANVDIEFERHDRRCEVSDVSRKRKFVRTVDEVSLPWHLRETLIDAFPTIERHFANSHRKNFINVKQLLSTLCQLLGYGEQASMFKGLKTSSRRLGIERFVKDAFGGGLSLDQSRRLEYVMPLTPLNSNLPVDPRVCVKNRIYTDINETRQNRKKTKVKLLRKL